MYQNWYMQNTSFGTHIPEMVYTNLGKIPILVYTTFGRVPIMVYTKTGILPYNLK